MKHSLSLSRVNGLAAALFVSALSVVGTVHAAVPAAVATSFGEMQEDFETIFAAGFAVLAAITLAMIAWKYTRKLGNKL